MLGFYGRMYLPDQLFDVPGGGIPEIDDEICMFLGDLCPARAYSLQLTAFDQPGRMILLRIPEYRAAALISQRLRRIAPFQ